MRGSNKGESLLEPGYFHSPEIHNAMNNYSPDAHFVSSEDAIKFQQWMRTDKVEFEMSRPHYKTYYDHNFEFFKDRSFYLSFLCLFYAGCYGVNKWYIESCRWHTHRRRTQLRNAPAHHFNNRGGVLIEKEFIGFTKYLDSEGKQMEWLKKAYPQLYKE